MAGGAPNILLIKLANERDMDNYYLRCGTVLAEGYFGETIEVTDVKVPSKHYAMKIQPKDGVYDDRSGPEAEGEYRRLYRELLILDKILPRHPNIVELQAILTSKANVYIVQELCKGGDMHAFFSVADNASGRRAFRQLVEAVYTLHEHGVIHGDMKPDNILFKDPEFEQLKLIDFGCSSYRPDLADDVNNRFDPKKWFNNEETDQDKVRCTSKITDIIALGKMLHGIMSGKPAPFSFSDVTLRLQTDCRPRTEMFDEAAMDLLRRIGTEPFGPRRAEDLWTINQIRQHPWLTGTPFQRQDEPLGHHFMQLRTDLTVVEHLLRDWMVPGITVLRNDQQLSFYYTIRGRVTRGNEETGILDVVDTLTSSKRKAMKVTYLRGIDRPQFAPGGFETKPSGPLYLELLITLRILPRHERLVILSRVYLRDAYVVVLGELMEGRTLEEFFRLSVSITKSCAIFNQLADTVRFLHRHGVVHMDFHPRHIVFKNDSPEYSWKIGDFSKARFVPEIALQRHEKFEARRLIPPEMENFQGSASDVQVDITALGRILHAMMAGRWEPEPARCANLLPRSDIFGDAATDLLSRIGPQPFGPAVANRSYTMDEICQHPWLQQFFQNPEKSDASPSNSG